MHLGLLDVFFFLCEKKLNQGLPTYPLIYTRAKELGLETPLVLWYIFFGPHLSMIVQMNPTKGKNKLSAIQPN